MQTKIQRTYKIGDVVILQELPHIVNRATFNQRDTYTCSMLKQSVQKIYFVVTEKLFDKWYKIQEINPDAEYVSEWNVRYNWITPVEAEEGPIAQIIWNAITYLQESVVYNPDREGENYSSQFTCDCIAHAYIYTKQNKDLSNVRYEDVMDFLNSLGFKYAFNSFKEYEEGEKRQGARFQWLHFAYWIAKEEGI